MSRRVHALAYVSALLAVAAACAEPAGSIVVEVDAEPAVLVRLRHVEVATFDGDVELDSTDVAPTGAPPACLPFSVGVAPAEGHEDLPVGVVVTARLADGRTITKRADTHFARGTRLWSVVLGEDCLGASGCDRTEVIDALPEVDRAALERRIAATPCRVLPTPLECVNRGGCFATYDPLAPLCELPCGAPTEPAPPEDPTPPRDVAPPSLTPCPAGWSEVPASAGSPATCEPWTIAETCPMGQVRFPGDASCAPLGAPCPADGWPATIPAGAPQLFVSPTAPDGGDGSRAAPLRSLDAALG
ncbi:hypothetical protein L6R52_44405, partial [Myxococcota bacterium]|nr:hypothetical protein [Myxococcota bacterium]